MNSDDKIVSLSELEKICKENKKEGKKIVLSYGCFDLLHPGHIRHLKSAKEYGDVLVVCITPDRYVEKGPGRPVFNEQLRAESVSSLSEVDFVVLNKWDNCVKLIEYLKPNFYVKGKDYSKGSEEFTSTILQEEKALKKVNGELRFTDEITFSSSSIINERFDVLSKDAKEYVKKLKQEYDSKEIIEILKNLNDLNVLIIGDAILDEYIFCKAMGKPEKAAVVSTKYLYSETYAGGSLAVANHISGFVKNTHLVSCIGNDNLEKFIKKKLRSNIDTKFFRRKYAPTILKTRYIEKSEKSKLFEISKISDEFIDNDLEKLITEYLKETIPKYDMAIITDFGHGLITKNIQEIIKNKSKFTAVNAQTNSANFGFNLITKYKDVEYISIDERELRLPYRERHGEIEPLITTLIKDTKCNKINITLGGSGSIFCHNKKTYFAPVFSTNVVDSVGAGDAVLVGLLARLRCRSCPPGRCGQCGAHRSLRPLGGQS